MESIKLNFSPINDDFTKFSSKFLGDVAIPRKWLDDDIFSENDIFLAQINFSNLEYFDTGLLKKGLLYFFLDITDFSKCKVLYTLDNDLVTVGFNDEIKSNYNLSLGYNLTFTNNKEFYFDGTKMFGNPAFTQLESDEILLFQFDSLDNAEIDFLSDKECYIQFIIKKDDFQKFDFSKVYVKVVES